MTTINKLDKKAIRIIINETLDYIKVNRPNDYILLLAGMHLEQNGWGKFIFNGSNSLAPAVRTLEDHITTFLKSRNRIKSRLPLYDGLLLYAHIWETYWFQLRLLRIVCLVSNQDYPWYIPGTKPGSDFFEAGNFYAHRIFQPLEKSAKSFANLLHSVYRHDIRNFIAHGDFALSTERSISFGYREYSSSNHKGGKENNITMTLDEWQIFLDNAILFYKSLGETIYYRRQAFIKAHPAGSIEIKLPIELNTLATLEWSSDKALAGYFIPKSPYISQGGLYQTEEEKKAYQQHLRELTASLNR